MRGEGRLINIRYNDGVVKRLPRLQAALQIELGRARYISNTLYKAGIAGIKVQEGQSDTEVKAAIRAATAPPEKTAKNEKAPQPQKRRRRRQKVEAE